MLLIFAGSTDETCNLLLSRLGHRAFRLNFDLFRDYVVEIGLEDWRIANPTGHEITNHTAHACFWWKPFNYFIDDNDYVIEEVKYIFRELYGWFMHRGLVRGNSHLFHQQRGKLLILQLAKKYFAVPDTLAGWNLSDGRLAMLHKSVVAKSLTSGLVTTSKVLYTTEVEPVHLDKSYPWFLQSRITAEADITIQVVGRNFFAFSRHRHGLQGLDWRQEIFTENHERARWEPVNLTSEQYDATMAFVIDLGVAWGRLDFLMKEGK